jgi:integrase/recombinase XerC
MKVLEEFIDYIKIEKRYSPHTVRAYTDDILQFNNFLTGQLDPSDLLTVNQINVRQWVLHLFDTKISARSLRRKIASLNAFYKYCLRNEKIKFNPVEGIILPRIDKKIPEFIRETSIEKLFDDQLFEKSFSGMRDKFVLELFYATGIRLSELIGLTDGSYDEHRSELKVHGKRNKERIIPLTNHIISLIGEYLIARNEKFGRLEHKFLIVNDNGAPAYGKMIQRLVRKYLEQGTTLDKKSPHLLRHTFATHMLNHGADLNAVKEILGHANLAATEIYTHNTYEKLKSIYKQAHPRA